VKLFNESHPQDLQQIVAAGLHSEKQKEYLKKIL
jgi:hypothetical protein